MNECIGQHPTAQYKVDLLREYGLRYELGVLVETGLYNGNGSGMHVAPWQPLYYVIDAQEENCRIAQERFPEAVVRCGDSADWLPLCLERIGEPALFWLDAHAIYTDECVPPFPLLAELRAIASHAHGDEHVVLIDDLCMFGEGSNVAALHESPSQEYLRGYIDSFGLWQREEMDCIMRLTPK